MKYFKIFMLNLFIVAIVIECDQKKDVTNTDKQADFSGVYCLNIQNLEMTITQTGNNVIFTLQSDLLTNGTGTITGDTLRLAAFTNDSASFSGELAFSKDRQSFSGPFQVTDKAGKITTDGILLGTKGECAQYDIEVKGIPKFVKKDFTQLSKIEMISKFRSGFGHSFTDGFEICRSMKHYYAPYEKYRKNNTVEIYSPVTGTIISVLNDWEGASNGLTNNEIQIKPDGQPAFTIVIFHCDRLSTAIAAGKKVHAGELLGYARLYYENWGEYVTCFDIAVWVNTPSGARLVPYFDTTEDIVFNNYISRGVLSRQDFTITQESRNADPLECDGEEFVTSGHLENWVILH